MTDLLLNPKRKRTVHKVPAAQLSLRELRARGYLCEIVERWNPHAKVRHDLFGFVDIIAVRDGETLAVQTTSVDHVPHRVTKIQQSPTFQTVRAAGWVVVVHGWKKRAGRWVLAREVMPAMELATCS